MRLAETVSFFVKKQRRRRMLVYQIRMKIFLLQNIDLRQVQTKLTAFLDKGFKKNDKLLMMHETNNFKGYCYDLPWPTEEDKIYKKDKIYTVTIRTIDEKLAEYFQEVCVNSFTDEIKGLTSDIRIIPKKPIESLYTLTPIVMKNEEGYWRTHMRLEEFEERLKVNLIKKWNSFGKDKLSEDFQLYTLLEFLNRTPVAIEYKNIKLLGDKIRLHIADNEIAQNLSYMALGTGVLEMNSRGLGYVNYCWL